MKGAPADRYAPLSRRAPPPGVTSPAPPDRRPLSERYRPTRLAEMVGNSKARAELAAWADAWDGEKVPARRAVILVGPPGVGKTSAAVALAQERGWALVEMNASEARNQAAIERVAGRASLTQSLDALPGPGHRHRTLILLDEADCLSGGRTSEGSRPASTVVALRSFLEGRYGTVAALNAAWGLAAGTKTKPFDAWTAIPRTPGNSAWAKLPAARRDLDDWKASAEPEPTGDRGGMGAIARLLRSTRQPLVLTVNEDRPLHRASAVFRSAARTIVFGPIASGDLSVRLAAIARSERVELGPSGVAPIVARAAGDLRAALNDLEAIALLPPGAPRVDPLGGRDRASDFADFTGEVLSRPRYYRTVEVRERLDAPPDDLLPWIEENVPWFAEDARHRDAGFARLRAADLLLARARRWRAYGLWSYATEILTGGTSLAVRDRPLAGGGHAAFPQFLGAMGYSRSARGVRDAVVAKLGHRLHLSKRKSRATALPFLEALLGEAAGLPPTAPRVRTARAVVAELELLPEEVAGLLGLNADSPAVRHLLPEASEEAEAVAEPEPSSAPEAPARARGQRRLGDWAGN